jgi:hypothetical protein
MIEEGFHPVVFSAKSFMMEESAAYFVEECRRK